MQNKCQIEQETPIKMKRLTNEASNREYYSWCGSQQKYSF